MEKLRSPKNKPELLDWKDTGDFIEGMYCQETQEGYDYHPFTILYNELEAWVTETGRLEWVHDYVDHRGEHVQNVGVTDFVSWLNCITEKDVLEFLEERITL